MGALPMDALPAALAVPITGLTPTMREVQLILQRAIDDTGVPPTVREIARQIGIAAPSGVHRVLTSLEQRGWIERARYRARAVTLKRRLPDPEAPR